MDHVVYLDAKSEEMDELLCGIKSMIIRGGAGRRIPYGSVYAGDMLYFINNNGEGFVKARGKAISVFNSEKITRREESVDLILRHQDKLQLYNGQLKRWAAKRYIVLVEVADVEHVVPFGIDKNGYRRIDGWLPVGNIETVKL